MSFEAVMAKVTDWMTAAQALSALGAELRLQESSEPAPPEVISALRQVSTAAGLDLDDLAPPQRAIALALIGLTVRHANELFDDPGREPGWTYTDPVILDGWGRASGMVPMLIAAAHPDLADVRTFLDVGTGVGLLAISAATNVWPQATVVGIDRWEPSLERARDNIANAGLSDRITLRNQELGDLDDDSVYDCAWVPTFFLTEDLLAEVMPALRRAVRPGGWVVVARAKNSPDPLAEAADALETLRAGGHKIDSKRAIEILEQAGLANVHTPEVPGPAPLELVLGQRPG